MKITLNSLFILLLCSACYKTSYLVKPSYGLKLKKGDTLLILPFEHEKIKYARQVTQELNDLFLKCHPEKTLSTKETQELLYKNLITIPLSKDEIASISQVSGADYLLFGKLFGFNPYNNQSHSFNYEERQRINRSDKFVTYYFNMIDLKRKEVAYEAWIKVKATSGSERDGYGNIERHHSAASTRLDKIAVRKSIKKLESICCCD